MQIFFSLLDNVNKKNDNETKTCEESQLWVSYTELELGLEVWLHFSFVLGTFLACIGILSGIMHTETAMFLTVGRTKQERKLQYWSPTNLDPPMVRRPVINWGNRSSGECVRCLQGYSAGSNLGGRVGGSCDINVITAYMNVTTC